jgi:hypothetical protein
LVEASNVMARKHRLEDVRRVSSSERGNT